VIVGWIFSIIVLLIGSIYDVKSYSLPMKLVLVGLCGGLVGWLYTLCVGEAVWWEAISSLLPGGLFALLAFLTREQIGYGDSLLLLMLGGCVGGEATLGIWISGLVVSFIMSVFLLVLRKADKKTRIPFVPCLLVGELIIGAGGWQGVW